jgi:hypothetical protein
MGELMSSPSPELDQLAAGAVDADDLRVLARVAAVYTQLDPVPAGLVDRVSFGITLAALHGEIAELQRTNDLAGARAQEAPVGSQTVTFTSSDLTTMVTITPSGADRVRIDGWVDPGAGVQVELRLPEQTQQTVADSDGRFVFADVPRGFAQFVLRRPDPGGRQRAVITPSIEL